MDQRLWEKYRLILTTTDDETSLQKFLIPKTKIKVKLNRIKSKPQALWRQVMCSNLFEPLSFVHEMKILFHAT